MGVSDDLKQQITSKVSDDINDINCKIITLNLTDKEFLDNFGKKEAVSSDGQQQQQQQQCPAYNPSSLVSESSEHYTGPDYVPLKYFSIPYRAKIIVEYIHEGKSVEESELISYVVNNDNNDGVDPEHKKAIIEYWYKTFGKKDLDETYDEQ